MYLCQYPVTTFSWPQALVFTLPPLAYIVALWMLFVIVFAIIGMAMFGDLLFRCTYGAEYPEGKTECSGSEVDLSRGILVPRAWYSPPYNFDSFPTAMLTLFRITFVKFIDIMRDCMDITSLDVSLLELNSQHFSLYFVAYILLGFYFIMNVFIAYVLNKHQFRIVLIWFCFRS